jgi:hypothetical protein
MPSAILAGVAESTTIQPTMLSEVNWEVNEKSADFSGRVDRNQQKNAGQMAGVSSF